MTSSLTPSALAFGGPFYIYDPNHQICIRGFNQGKNYLLHRLAHSYELKSSNQDLHYFVKDEISKQ